MRYARYLLACLQVAWLDWRIARTLRRCGLTPMQARALLRRVPKSR